MFRDIEPEDIYSFERKILVDVRSPAEFSEFHIPGAVNLPIFEDEDQQAEEELRQRGGLLLAGWYEKPWSV